MERKLIRLLVVSGALASMLVASAAHSASQTPAGPAAEQAVAQVRLSTASIW